MVRRSFMLAAAVALVVSLAGRGTADDKKPGDSKPGTHEGKVVKVSEGKLMMTGKDGKEKMTHAIPADAKVMCDGKACKLTDLKAGQTVMVTAEKKDDKVVVTKVEAKKADSDK